MKITINYGTGVATVPRDVLQVMDRATKTDLRLLILLSADPLLLSDCGRGDGIVRLAEQSGCSEAQIEASLAFWRGAGLLTLQDEDEIQETTRQPKSSASTVHTAPTSEVTSVQTVIPRDSTSADRQDSRVTVKKPHPESVLPHYTSEELADLLESRTDTKKFIDECTQVWGRILNVHEVNVLLVLVDYLGLEWEYVLTLLAFCVGNMKKQERKCTMRYVETTAYGLYDEGVQDVAALQEKIRRMEDMADSEKRLRRLLGIGDRELTSAEKKAFSKWLYDFGYDLEIITYAFEVNVDAKGKYSVKYMDAVLTNWYNEKLHTLEEIKAANERFKAEHQKPGQGRTVSAKQGSFDTDDFFNAAVRRSLGDDFNIPDDDGEGGRK
jgi:DnaD/phage-associated family protein